MMASTKTSKEKRTILNKTCSGVEKTKRLQLQALGGDFDKLNKNNIKIISYYFTRVISLVH